KPAGAAEEPVATIETAPTAGAQADAVAAEPEPEIEQAMMTASEPSDTLIESAPAFTPVAPGPAAEIETPETAMEAHDAYLSELEPFEFEEFDQEQQAHQRQTVPFAFGQLPWETTAGKSA